VEEDSSQYGFLKANQEQPFCLLHIFYTLPPLPILLRRSRRHAVCVAPRQASP
jgi:hypothetical protein